MTFQDLINSTVALVQDASFEEVIPQYINEALQQVVVEAQMPELKRAAIISTEPTSPYVFVGDVNSAGVGKILKVLPNVDRHDKRQYPSMEEMYQDLFALFSTNDIMYSAEDVRGIALEGRNLWYFPVPPVSEDFIIFYIANPQELAIPEDEITLDIPDHIQRKALCNAAAELCWRQLENGVDIPTPNTDRCKAQKEEGIRELKAHLGRTRPHMITSVWRS